MNQAFEKKSFEKSLNLFPSRHMLVVGDVMLDEFVWGEVDRISPEAPVPVVEVRQETMLLGGAANVAGNLKALGCRVSLGGIIGDDPMGRKFSELAHQVGINVDAVVSSSRPTTVKTRIVARGQQVVRVDRESRQPVDSSFLEEFKRSVEAMARDIDGIIVSDYAKGVVTSDLMNFLRDISSETGIPLFVDPKPVNAFLYKGVTLITPNLKEAEAISGRKIDGEDGLKAAIQDIQEKLSAECVLITMGARGMALWEKDAGLFSIPTMAKEVFDVTGAGDTVIATLALGVVSGLDFSQGAFLANVAAGVVVGKVGTGTVTVEEIKERLLL